MMETFGLHYFLFLTAAVLGFDRSDIPDGCEPSMVFETGSDKRVIRECREAIHKNFLICLRLSNVARSRRSTNSDDPPESGDQNLRVNESLF